MPLGHLGLNVYDLSAAKEYYDDFMPRVSFEPFIADDRQFSYRPAAGKVGTAIFFYGADDRGYERHREGLQHLAFMVKTRADVDAIHAWAVERGGSIVREPQELPQYHPGYYATFWLDPHGFMLEVVCHRDATLGE